MRRETRIQLVAVVIMLACLLGSAAIAVRMTDLAGRAQLSYADRAEDGDRWEVSLGIAMGAFRGIFVNALWMRANDMKEAGKFYDAVDLARAITRLQPRFPRVWIFHAWNLAYNISVQTQTREERWNWVNQGLAILRDEGIPANPNDMLMHKELAWIYLHKIQGYTDDANPYYKRMIAREWTVVLGEPPRLSGIARSREKSIDAFATWMQGYADAALSLEDLYRETPAARTLVERIQSDLQLNFDTKDNRRIFLERVEATRSFLSSSRKFIVERASGPRTQALLVLFNDPALKDAWDPLMRYVRRRVLVEDYHMEPDRMVRYTRKYGPIDWRHAAAHSLYWSARGVEEALDRTDERNRKDFDYVNTDRIVVQSLQELFRSGELYYDFRASVLGIYTMWIGVPNPHFVESYGNVLDEMRKRPGNIYDQQNAARGFSPLSAGYENFLIDATLFFYRRGERERAEMWLKRLREYPDQNLTDPEGRIQRFLNLDDFAKAELNDRFGNPSVAVNQVTASLMGAYASGLLGRDPELFASQFKFAADAHRYYIEKQARRTAVDTENARMELLDRDFPFVAGTLFYQFVGSLGIEDAETVYNLAPDGLKVYAYDALVESQKAALDEQAKFGGRRFDEAFPAPKGLEAHREAMQRRLEERTRGPSNLQRN